MSYAEAIFVYDSYSSIYLVLHVCQQRDGTGGRSCPPRCFLKQGQAERMLKGVNATCDGRLVDAKTAGGRQRRTLSHDGEENADIAPISEPALHFRRTARRHGEYQQNVRPLSLSSRT